MKQIRRLKADDVELKPCFENKETGLCKYLVYIDSRAVTVLLDETYGPENWLTDYFEAGGLIFCKLSIYDEETERWVYRTETGTEKNIEREKAICSDALKRCISRFSVTELYSCPNISLPKRNDYRVSLLDVSEDRKVERLVIVDGKGNVVMDWHKGQPVSTSELKDNATILTEWCTAHKHQEGYPNDTLKDFYTYWMGRIKDGKFNGVFQPEKMWEKQQNRRAA